jgi:hypothetical protein
LGKHWHLVFIFWKRLSTQLPSFFRTSILVCMCLPWLLKLQNHVGWVRVPIAFVAALAAEMPSGM